MDNKLYKNLFGVSIVMLSLLLLWVIGNAKRQPIEEFGVFVILTADQYLRGTYYGKLFTYNYYYKNKRYNSNEVLKFTDTLGVRYFIQILPSDPTRKIISYAVPSWFTLDAPPEGWKTMPNEVEMRDMMVQDSIKRGLK